MYDKKINEESAFGPTAEAHSALMVAIWGPGINMAILLAMYSYRKWWGYLHGLAGAFACIYTISTTLPTLLYTGIISSQSKINYGDYRASTLNYHYLVGIACLSVILIEGVLGAITKSMYFLNAKSMNIIRIKKLHAVFGYLIVILCKSNYVIILYGDGSVWLLLAQDIVFAMIIIIRKTKFPQMGAAINQVPEDEDADEEIHIQSIKQLPEGRQCVVFANYVYDIEPLKNYHPGGYQIIQSVKNRQVDRFIYGMLPSEALPDVPTHSHSYKSLTLLGPPFAKITIPSTYSGFIDSEAQVKVESLKMISEKGCIYQMQLRKVSGKFNHQRYTHISQLGRYFSLTLNDKITRLYTNVGFLDKPNKLFMKKNLEGYKNECGTSVSFKSEGSQRSNIHSEDHLIQNYIPILFKKYHRGKLTDFIVNNPITSLTLSCPKGQGLQMTHLKPGKVIIIAGGTGIYPFSDLIDILYKCELMQEHPQFTKDILNLSPILHDNNFNNFTFYLMVAFNNFDDIHPITFYQIAYLTSRKKLGLTLKIKDLKDERIKQLRNVRLIDHSFEEELRKELKQGAISKIWICGPPKMNENVSLFLQQLYSNKQIFLII